MNVEELGPGADDEYGAFLESCPGSLLYHSVRYRELLRRLISARPRYLLAREGGRISGALPLMFLPSEGRRVYNSLPYFGSHGDVLARTPEARRALLDAYREIVTGEAVRCATLVRNPFAPGSEEGIPHTFTEERISQATELPEGEDPREEILAGIDPTARRNVRKAEARGFVVEDAPEEMDRLRVLHQQGMAAIGGTAKADAFFDLVPQFFRPWTDYGLYVARADGEVVSALLVFFHGDFVEYFVPATHPEHRSHQPLSAILIHAMSEAARRGRRVWNWGGTQLDQVGVFRFKRKWSNRETRYRYLILMNDDSLLDRTPEELLSAHPGFYTVPFSRLRCAARGDPVGGDPA